MYLETAKQRLSPYVYERYTHIIDLGIIPALGHLKLRDIRPVHIQRFIDDLSKRDTHLDGKPGKLSPSTVRRYYTMICSLMKSAYNLGLIGINPAERERITLPKLEEEQTEIFTEQELGDLLQALEDEPLMFRLLIHMALNTGCRRGELMGLNKPMYPTTPTQWFSKFQKRNDVPHRKFHALRHTSATLLLSNGTNIKNVATRLGHTQLKTTNRYVHAVEQAERQAANTLELLLGGNRKTGVR